MRPRKRDDDYDDDDVTDKLVTSSVSRQETLNLENLRVDGNIKLIIKKVKQSCYRPGVAQRVPGS
jgi:hypothetical protein